MFEMKVGYRLFTKKHRNGLVTSYVVDENDIIVAKKCNRCLEIMGLEQFNNNSANELDGRVPKCKKCAKQYREENKEYIAERRKKYNEENRERIAEREKKYNEENKERIDAYQKKHREKNKEHIATRKRKYYEENKERLTERARQHYKENKELINKRRRKKKSE